MTPFSNRARDSLSESRLLLELGHDLPRAPPALFKGQVGHEPSFRKRDSRGFFRSTLGRGPRTRPCGTTRWTCLARETSSIRRARRRPPSVQHEGVALLEDVERAQGVEARPRASPRRPGGPRAVRPKILPSRSAARSRRALLPRPAALSRGPQNVPALASRVRPRGGRAWLQPEPEVLEDAVLGEVVDVGRRSRIRQRTSSPEPARHGPRSSRRRPPPFR